MVLCQVVYVIFVNTFVKIQDLSTTHNNLTMMPSLVTLLFTVLYPALNHALALPPARSRPTGKMGTLMIPMNSSLLRRGCSLIKMRGGGDDDIDSDSDGYEYDLSSSDEEEFLPTLELN